MKTNWISFDTKEIESEIKCPYCGYLFSDSWEYGSGDNEWTEDIECPECDKKFSAYRCVTVDYRTSQDCELNNEKHEWVEHMNSLMKNDWYVCKKCKATIPKNKLKK